MSGDGTIDGRFTIESGQGISQAIRDELGLTSDDCKKMNKSIWTEIINEIKVANDSLDEKIYSGGSDIDGATNKNFVVESGQEIILTETTWGSIIEKVNKVIGREVVPTTTHEPVATPEPVVTPESTPTPAETVTTNITGAIDKFNQAQAEGKELLADVKNAINNGEIEGFAGASFVVDNDIDDYSEDAISYLLSDNTSEEQVKQLLENMTNSRKVTLMKHFNTSFDKTTVENADLINAAKNYYKQLEVNANTEKTQINKAKEETRQKNITNLTSALTSKDTEVINNEHTKAFSEATEKGKTLETKLQEAINDGDLEDFARENNWFFDDMSDFNKNAKSYLLSIDSAKENVKLLLLDMSMPSKVKLMKEFDPSYTEATVTDEGLIEAAKKYYKQLETDKKTESNEISTTLEAYNNAVKTIAKFFYADKNTLQKEESSTSEGNKVITVTDPKDSSKKIIITYGLGSERETIKKIEIDGVTITMNNSSHDIIKGDYKYRIPLKNLSTRIRSILANALNKE